MDPATQAAPQATLAGGGDHGRPRLSPACAAYAATDDTTGPGVSPPPCTGASPLFHGTAAGGASHHPGPLGGSGQNGVAVAAPAPPLRGGPPWTAAPTATATKATPYGLAPTPSLDWPCSSQMSSLMIYHRVLAAAPPPRSLYLCPPFGTAGPGARAHTRSHPSGSARADEGGFAPEGESAHALWAIRVWGQRSVAPRSAGGRLGLSLSATVPA